MWREEGVNAPHTESNRWPRSGSTPHRPELALETSKGRGAGEQKPLCLSSLPQIRLPASPRLYSLSPSVLASRPTPSAFFPFTSILRYSLVFFLHFVSPHHTSTDLSPSEYPSQSSISSVSSAQAYSFAHSFLFLQRYIAHTSDLITSKHALHFFLYPQQRRVFLSTFQLVLYMSSALMTLFPVMCYCCWIFIPCNCSKMSVRRRRSRCGFVIREG